MDMPFPWKQQNTSPPFFLPPNGVSVQLTDGSEESFLASTATVATHESVAPDWVQHLYEGEGPHSDVSGAQHLEIHLLVEGNQEILAHEDGTAHIGQAAEVLQVAPHEDGAFSLLPERPVDSQDVDVDRGSMRLVEGHRVLRTDNKCEDRSALLEKTERETRFKSNHRNSQWSRSSKKETTKHGFN